MNLILRDLALSLRHPFTISQGTTTVQENLLVALREGNLCGYGEGASSHAYHAFTAASMRADLEAARARIEAEQLEDPAALWDRLLPVLGHNRFALCALDEAAHDLWGKQRGQPVWKLWGLELRNLPESNYTIGIDTIERMVMKMREFDGVAHLQDQARHAARLGNRARASQAHHRAVSGGRQLRLERGPGAGPGTGAEGPGG